MKPKFSIIIPSYNRAGTLGRAIESIINQTYPAHEIIVVDDGSSDNSKEVVEVFPNVRYIYQDNAGVSSARNKGAELTCGDWLIFLDSDDEINATSLIQFANAISTNPNVEVIQSGFEIKFDKFTSIHIPKPFSYHTPLAASFTIKKEFFLKLGGYDPVLKFAENTELFHRISILGGQVKFIEEVTLIYHQNQQGGSKDLFKKSTAILHLLEKHNTTLTHKNKRLYHQILGVNYMRAREFEKARNHLIQAFLLDPKKLGTLGRLLIALVPVLAKKLYPNQPT